MAHKNIGRRAAAAMIALAATIGVGALGAGQAAAETVVPMERCWGVSPNVVDQPFSTARLFVTSTGPGRVNAAIRDVSTPWAFFIPGAGYESVGRLDWRNVNTGGTGTAFDSAHIGSYVSGPEFSLDTGPGTVTFTVSAVNRNALWAIPSTACSGTMQVR
jgi:hypothetical protein